VTNRKKRRRARVQVGRHLTPLQQQTLAAMALLAAFGIWWVVGRTRLVNPILLPPPFEVLTSFVALVRDGTLPRDIGVSLLRVVEGFVLALAVALPLGVVMGIFPVVRGFLEPLLELVRPIPPIAVIPLAMLWFGIGELSKVAIIMYGAFFPILVNTMAGFAEVDPIHIRAAETLGATRPQIFRDVVMRSAFPYMVVGARLGMGMAFIVLVAAELIASSVGLGYLINDARYRFRTDQMLLGMSCIGVLGFVLNKILLDVDRHIVRWKEQGGRAQTA